MNQSLWLGTFIITFFPPYIKILDPHHFYFNTFLRNTIHLKLKKYLHQNMHDFHKSFMNLNPKSRLICYKNILSTWILFTYAENKERVRFRQQIKINQYFVNYFYTYHNYAIHLGFRNNMLHVI